MTTDPGAKSLFLLTLFVMALLAALALGMKKSSEFHYSAIQGCTVRADVLNPGGPSPFGVFKTIESAEQFVCHRLPYVHDAHGWMPLDITAFSGVNMPDVPAPMLFLVTFRFASGTSDHVLDVQVSNGRQFIPGRQWPHHADARGYLWPRPYNDGPLDGYLVPSETDVPGFAWRFGGDTIVASLEVSQAPNPSPISLKDILPLLRSIR